MRDTPTVYHIGDARGVAIVVTLILLGIMIAIGVGLASIFSREIRISGSVDDSVSAAIAADAGVERALYMTRKGGGDGDNSYGPVTLVNGAIYEVCRGGTDCDDPNPVRIVAVGTYQNTKRSFEVCYDDQGGNNCDGGGDDDDDDD